MAVLSPEQSGSFHKDGYLRFGRVIDDETVDRMRAGLEENVPAVRGKIEIAELSTPLSTRHFMNYSRGEAYGVSAPPQRFRLRCLTPQTALRNLYLTGQDVCMPGVTGAMMGGAVTASAVLGRNLVSRITKPSPQARKALLSRSQASSAGD